MAGLQGRTLGGYQLTEQIASAGIAEVYRARPLAANGREVVIKVIYPEFARYPSFLPNFQHIVQTAARLANHPHILPVVASGEENGYLYLATPWVAEGTLRDWITRGGRLGATDVGPFFQQLCSALEYAHSLGLAHGNLKPSNVFLYEGRHVMLGDFGMLWDIRQLDMNHSGSGTDVVEYLAPESFSGQFSQQSDIYSLGAILFATLTGRPPFSAAKPADLRDAHMQFPPPRLGQVDPSLPPAVQALDAVIQQAMAKNPQQRFPSAMAVAQAIDATLRQRPAMPAARPAPALPPAQPGPAQPGPQQPDVPGSWAVPGPIQPPTPSGAIGGLPGAGGPVARPLDPPFPPLNGGQSAQPPMAQGWPAQPDAPLAQGWPAAPALADPIQYTERVPAPPAARPLLSRPQLPAPVASPPPAPEQWGAQNVPPMGDDPDWNPDQWLGAERMSGAPRQQPSRDDDWQRAQNGAGLQSQTDYSSQYSEYTDQRLALRDGGYNMSRADWAGVSQSGTGPHSEALRYRGGFSATELGLPRLTNPALQGELPPEWEDLLADEHLPSRADLDRDPPRRPPPARRAPQSNYGSNNGSRSYAPDRPPSRPAGGRGPADASDGRSYWQPAVGNPGPQRAQPMPTLASAHQPAYTANRMAPPPAARSRAVRQDERERPKRRRWPWTLFLLALLLVLVGGTGVVLVKPTVCPGTVCSQANHFLRAHLTFLGPAPNANVLHATPDTLSVQAITGSSTNLNVQISNAGTDSAVWHATASVGWLTITPASGTLAPGAAATLSVVATPLDITPGNYSAMVRIETPDTVISIPITAAISGGPKIKLSTETLNVSGSQCGAPQTFKVNNTGDTPLSYTVTSSSATDLQLSGASGSVNPGADATITFTIKCSAFFDDYTLKVTSNGGNGTVTIHYG